jgi:aryl-alcohol dehydrogenase-like predicted oxidoreductase
MPTSTITLAGVEIPRIGLGTNRLTQDRAAFIREAVEAGVRHIDTAHLYTGGDSEKTIGAALGGRFDDLVLATKGGYASGDGRPEVLRRQVEQSLKSLQTDVIPLYYLHRVDAETPLEESLGAIKEYVDRGAIRAVGLSEVTVEQLERGRQVVDIAAVQNHYNLDERKYDEVVDHCAREGLVFVPFFPLRGGDDPAIAEIAKRHAVTPNAVKLAWLLHRSPAMAPIPGTLSIEHLRENLAALDVELSDEEFAAIGAVRA